MKYATSATHLALNRLRPYLVSPKIAPIALLLFHLRKHSLFVVNVTHLELRLVRALPIGNAPHAQSLTTDPLPIHMPKSNC